MMDIKTAIILGSKRYVGPTVVVLLLLAGGMSYVWAEYKELLKERKSLNNEIALFEKTRSEASVVMIAKKAELDKREFTLQQLESQNKEKLAALQLRSSEYEAAFGKLEQAQSSVSRAQQEKEAENKIQTLMSEFSSMGINLNEPIRCGDTDDQKRYNTALAKYIEIYTLAEAKGMKSKYNNFFFHNGRHVYAACEKS
ncbi:hypothetical protein [Chromobacterium violaceum]|uniref:hypothetical protein n=1 Tax=Chromobacterium violaceum TaxID=536 RepID=UPI0012D35DF2|nr:hypothetical protein [Chromobacterium violaceum]